MIDPTLDGYASQILKHHNARMEALALLQQRACSMVMMSDTFTASDEDVQAMTNLAAVIAIEPIQPLACVELVRLATMARNANA